MPKEEKKLSLCSSHYRSHIDRVKDFDSNIPRQKLASLVCSGVGISILGVETAIVLDVLKGLRGQTTVTAEVVESSGTVHKLLFRERDSPAMCLSVSCLERPGGTTKKVTMLELKAYKCREFFFFLTE